MTNRNKITAELNQLEQDIRGLEITYEQYFMGVEKREPLRERQKLSRKLRKLINHYIPQVDLRFRLQGISSRFHSYSGHWDRVVRLIDEGKYERHTSRIPKARQESPAMKAGPGEAAFETLYEKLVEAHSACGLKIPLKEQVAAFLTRQQDLIQQKFGHKSVDFQVITVNGKPKIKVRAKS